MANAIKGEVPLKLSDGREFVLKGGFDAMIEAESLYGKPSQQIIDDARDGYIGAVRALFYGMLKPRQPSITPSETSDLLAAHMPEIEAAMQAVNAASQATGGKEAANPPAGRRGKNSGRSGARRA